MRFIISCLILMLLICACSAQDDPFILPVNYTGEASMKVYTDKTENDYRVSIICRQGNYSIRTETENEAWNHAYVSGNRFVLTNDKFSESSVTIENFQLTEQLIHDFDFGKFDVLDVLPGELIYFDGTYKHILNFSKENLLPSKIFIYKNDKLVKAIQYEKLNIEE